jgi:type II secretion system protein I
LTGNEKACKKKGFTLLEVVISVAIVGVSLMILLSAVNRNIDIAGKSRDAQIAALLAQQMLTNIELEGFPQVREEEGEFQDNPGFNWFLSVLPYNLSLVETNIRIVRVLIVWNDGNDEFEVSTAISN